MYISSVFIRTDSLRTPSNMLIVALALSDLIMIQHQGPCLTFGMMISKYWPYGKLFCRLYGFLGGINGEFFIVQASYGAIRGAVTNLHRLCIAVVHHLDWLRSLQCHR